MGNGRLAGIAIRLAIVAALLALAWSYRNQAGEIGGALRHGGWAALVALCLWHLVPLGLCALALRTVAREGGFARFLATRWVRESVADLAAFLPLAGELSAGRMLTRVGFGAVDAAALTVVDITVETVAEFLFCLAGVLLWLLRHRDGEIAHWGLIGLAIAIPVVVALVLLQRSAAVRLLETLPARLMPRLWRAPAVEAGVLARIRMLHGERGRLAAAGAIHLAGWLAASGEIWLAARLLGHPLALADAAAMESLIAALRSAAFLVPGALGVQEGGYLVLGQALGLPPEVALAVALLRRGREIALGVPGLAIWQIAEGRFGRKAPD